MEIAFILTLQTDQLLPNKNSYEYKLHYNKISHSQWNLHMEIILILTPLINYKKQGFRLIFGDHKINVLLIVLFSSIS